MAEEAAVEAELRERMFALLDTLHSTPHHFPLLHFTTRQGTILHGPIRHETTRYETKRNNTIRHDTTRHETTRNDTKRHGTIRHETTRYDTLTPRLPPHARCRYLSESSRRCTSRAPSATCHLSRSRRTSRRRGLGRALASLMPGVHFYTLTVISTMLL